MKNISFKDYLRADAISASDILNFQRTPRDFARMKGLIEGGIAYESSAMRMGTMVHTHILEPDEFWDRYVVEPDCLPNGDKIRRKASDGSLRKTSEGKAFLDDFNQKNQDKELITPQEMEQIARAARAVMANSEATQLLKGALIEQSLFWSNKGINCKGRPDAVNNGVLIDLKTCRDITPQAFEAESYRRKYHQKQAWYKQGLQMAGVEINRVTLITLCNDECIVRDMGDELISRGEEANARTLDRLMECLTKKDFPSWPEIIPLGIPSWALVDLFNEGDL